MKQVFIWYIKIIMLDLINKKLANIFILSVLRPILSDLIGESTIYKSYINYGLRSYSE